MVESVKDFLENQQLPDLNVSESSEVLQSNFIERKKTVKKTFSKKNVESWSDEKVNRVIKWF